ncbi:MAG: HNH endonuclease signature motif containing protein [Patescibacteria group bacterium]|nr:HNH endonuclease signature motif containing protein [Patescibacteria group bacterium]
MAKEENRTKIPANLKRKVLVEAGHRCAIPTCRNIVVDIHHIVPWSKVKKHEYSNLIALCPNCHRLAEQGKIDRKSLRMYKSNLIYLYDRFSAFEIDVLFELNRIPPGQAMQFPSYLILLVKRIIEAGFIKWIQTPAGVKIGGMKSNPDYLQITDKGSEFIDNLNSKDVGY